jgi:hypothetical protein
MEEVLCLLSALLSWESWHPTPIPPWPWFILVYGYDFWWFILVLLVLLRNPTGRLIWFLCCFALDF